MELTYTVRGADGKEYGPVGLEQLNRWIREGRLPAKQEVRRSDMQHWAPAEDFAELQSTYAAPEGAKAPASAGPATVAARQNAPASLGQLKSGASWFYWIAGLSLINSIVAFTGSSWRFILGLGITGIIDELGGGMSGSGRVIALALNILVAGVFIVFGVFANKGQAWAFLAGMVLFALDGVIFLLDQRWIGVAFHAFVLYCFFRGFQACRELRRP